MNLLIATRPKQWVKNLLVFCVPLSAGLILESSVAFRTIISFLCFCFISSATYLVNDIFDMEADLSHPIKKNRPIAAGKVSKYQGYLLSIILVFGGLGISALLLNLKHTLLMISYLLIQAYYTSKLKKIFLFDIFAISAGFIIRALAGGFSTNIHISDWFLLVTASASIYVVSGKRYSEKITFKLAPNARKNLNLYSENYLRNLWSVSLSTSIMFYALWAVDLNRNIVSKFTLLSILPFSIIFFLYAKHIDSGEAESPEEVIMNDKVIILMSFVWITLFSLGLIAK